MDIKVIYTKSDDSKYFAKYISEGDKWCEWSWCNRRSRWECDYDYYTEEELYDYIEIWNEIILTEEELRWNLIK